GYEEEVRVVKNIKSNNSSRYSNSKFKNEAGNWNQVTVMGRPLYCLSIPKESIVEIFLGCASYSNVTRLGVAENFYTKTRQEWQMNGANVQLVRRKEGTWKLEISEHII
ncbi:MAG: hypothetical protein ACJAXJ_004289, partial [Colwellia sp.]